jgi:hypothetical protein
LGVFVSSTGVVFVRRVRFWRRKGGSSLHELGRWCDPSTSQSEAEEGEPVLEVTAESAAWIVGAGLLGLDMIEASSTYVASWLERIDTLMRTSRHSSRPTSSVSCDASKGSSHRILQQLWWHNPGLGRQSRSNRSHLAGRAIALPARSCNGPTVEVV